MCTGSCTSTSRLTSKLCLWLMGLLISFVAVVILQTLSSAQGAQITSPAPTLSAIWPSEAYNYSQTTAMITGTGFFALTGTMPTLPRVTLNTVELADVTLVNSATLTATVPAHLPAGNYTVIVTNPDGQSASLPDAFTMRLSGQGDLDTWQETSALLVPRLYPTAAEWEGWIYVVGGSEDGGTGLATVERAQILADGSLSPWQMTSPLNTPRWMPGAIAVGGFLYTLGGDPSTASVERAPINPDGSLGAWEYMTSMNVPRGAFSAVVVGRYLYAIGGNADTSVERAEILPDGLLGEWEYTGATNDSRDGAPAVVAGDHVYVLGGIHARTSVERALINADGSLGPWQRTTPLATPRNRFVAVIREGYLYVLGGEDGVTPLRAVERAPAYSDGSLGPWLATTPTILERDCLAAAAAGSYIYAIAGRVGTLGMREVEYAFVDPASMIDFTPSAVTSDYATPVVIRGSGFRPIPALQLENGTALSLTYVSPVTLTTYIPANLTPGWYAAMLTNGDDRTATLTYAVRVDGPGQVVVGDYSVTINGGALFTNKITVTLTLGSQSDTALMQVSNDGGFPGAQWETYTSHKTWQITQYGNYVIPRVVYVRYKDIAGNTSLTVQDDIVLDVMGPEGFVRIMPGTRQAGPHAEGTNAAVTPLSAISATDDYSFTVHLPLVNKNFWSPPSGPPNVTLQLSAEDDVSGVADMLISNLPAFPGAAWEPYVTTKPWHVPEGTTTTVYVKFRDYAGNISAVVTDTISMP